jgi:hypothetical protein
VSRVFPIIFLAAALCGAQAGHAQMASTAVPSGGQSSNKQAEQLAACELKIAELSEQIRPLQLKRTGLWSERKTVGHSGGETAKFKLAAVDKELLQITRQLDGVNGQINSEKKRCDDLAAKASGARGAAPARQSGRP